jgi:hypothetical protein
MNFPLISLPFIAIAGANKSNFMNYVNTYIGTSFDETTLDYGNTVLQVGMPLAHSPWTPTSQVNENKCTAPYYHTDEHWIGMRKTHWMSGSCVIDYGSVTVLPSLTLDINDAISFHNLNHEKEISSPAVSQFDSFICILD